MSNEYTNKMRESEKELIMKKLSVILKQIGTIQENTHSLLIDVVLYSFKNRSDLSVVTTVMNSISNYKGSFSVESVGFWLTEIAGIRCEVKEQMWHCKLNRLPSNNGIKFTYDKAHLAECKREELRFWRIAPRVLKELKLAEDITKVTASSEVQMARLLASGKMSETEIAEHVANTMSRVIQIAKSGRTKDFLEEFYLQHPDQKPLEQQIADEEAEEVAIEELVSELDEEILKLSTDVIDAVTEEEVQSETVTA